MATVSQPLAEVLRNYSYLNDLQEVFAWPYPWGSRQLKEIKTRCPYEQGFRAIDHPSIKLGRLLGHPSGDLFAGVERELLEYVGHMVVHRALGEHEL
jgi:hypothetical protein